MTYLVDKLKEILEIESVKSEVEKKLLNTVMLVNKVPMVVKGFAYDNNTIMGYICNDFNKEEPSTTEVKDLDVYLPEPGTYISKDKEIVLMEKIPKRLWYKSFHDSQYKINRVAVGNSSPKAYGCDFIYNHCTRKDICVDKRNYIFYWNLNIGKIREDGSVLCVHPMFKQELLDWERRGRV